jgi:hypothetical protein
LDEMSNADIVADAIVARELLGVWATTKSKNISNIAIA